MSVELLQRLGVEIRADLLNLALTHSSFAYENNLSSNERLEFLGDSVLGYLVASWVFMEYPNLPEGDLTRLKNSIVSAEALAAAAKKIELGQFLRIGKGEESSGGRNKVSILSDGMEAIIAAAYISGGLECARKIVESLIFPMLGDPYALREFSDPKTSLLEQLSKLNLEPPRYEVRSSGPEHLLTYFATCYTGQIQLGTGEGRTIRSAEGAAAARAIAKLRENNARTTRG
jgi:ribonuclease-3